MAALSVEPERGRDGHGSALGRLISMLDPNLPESFRWELGAILTDPLELNLRNVHLHGLAETSLGQLSQRRIHVPEHVGPTLGGLPVSGHSDCRMHRREPPHRPSGAGPAIILSAEDHSLQPDGQVSSPTPIRTPGACSSKEPPRDRQQPGVRELDRHPLSQVIVRGG